MGIEPTTSAWKAGVLPLNYTRVGWIELIFYFVDRAKLGPLCPCIYKHIQWECCSLFWHCFRLIQITFTVRHFLMQE